METTPDSSTIKLQVMEFFHSQNNAYVPKYMFLDEYANITNINGNTTLFHALKKGLPDFIPTEALTDKNFAHTNFNGQTLFHVAAEFGQLETLLKRAPHLKTNHLPNLADKLGHTPFMIACKDPAKLKKYPKRLITKRDFEVINYDESTALHLLAQYQPTNILKKWITPKRLNAQNRALQTPAHYAIVNHLALQNYKHIINLITLKNAKLRDKHGHTPITAYIYEVGLSPFIKQIPPEHLKNFTLEDIKHIDKSDAWHPFESLKFVSITQLFKMLQTKEILKEFLEFLIEKDHNTPPVLATSQQVQIEKVKQTIVLKQSLKEQHLKLKVAMESIDTKTKKDETKI
jgi:hypothetical protein